MSNLYNLKKGVADETDVRHIVQAYSANGALDVKNHTAVVTKSTAAALTLRAPTAAEDGTLVRIVSATAAAHTVTAATIGFNDGGAAKDVGTFGGAKGDGFTAIAYNGDWFVLSATNVTFA